MKVFVAGASGAIGKPLIAELIRLGHTVTGMTQSEAGAKKVIELGADAEIANAFDGNAVEAALHKSGAEIVIDQLTALPRNPADLSTALPLDRKLRLEGGAHLQRAAQATGVKRYIQQSSGFFLKGDGGLADEFSPLATNASPGISLGAQMYQQIEARTLQSPIASVVLRYGFFYGPNTWYHPDGGAADQARQQQLSVIGKGQGVWSFVHIEDAAVATAAAVATDAGVYNIVDDDPSPVSIWLPAFAKAVGALAPANISEDAARHSLGEDAVYYGTELSGASNGKARRAFGFSPRKLEWLKS